MKMTWKKTSGNKRLATSSKLPFDESDDVPFSTPTNNNVNDTQQPNKTPDVSKPSSSDISLSDQFLHQGNLLAEDGKFREALGKWETAITLTPDKAVLHEQKAQVLLEIGDAWSALKAATRATELDPSWAEAWTTLGRAQLNFGEPDNAIESFDKALAMKPNLKDAQDDRQTALQLVRKRKHLHSSGLSTDRSRYAVGDVGGSHPRG